MTWMNPKSFRWVHSTSVSERFHQEVMDNTATKTCQCGRTFSDADSHGDTCFKCKIQGIRFTFRGATGSTRKSFHDTTIKEAIAESDRNIKAAGGKPEDYQYTANQWV